MEMTENKWYKCDFCSETLESRDLLDNHMFTCVEIKPVICPECYLVFGGQVQLDEHVLIVHSNDKRVPANDGSDEFSNICSENQDFEDETLPEELSDASGNSEEVKSDGDDIANEMGMLQDDGRVQEDLQMAVDADDDECEELADNSEDLQISVDPEGDGREELADNSHDSEEITDADAVGNLIELHRDRDELRSEEKEIIVTQPGGDEATNAADDDNENISHNEREELADSSEEILDADAVGNLIEQDKNHNELRYEEKEIIVTQPEGDESQELADNSEEDMIDADAVWNLIEQHKDHDELRYEEKEIIVTQPEGDEATNDADDDNENNSHNECEELADSSEEILDADAVGNLIEQHKDHDELISEEKEIIVTQPGGDEATRAGDNDKDSNSQIGEDCCENLDFEDEHLQLSDVSSNSEEVKLDSDEISNRMGLLQDDALGQEDLQMAVDPDPDEHKELADTSEYLQIAVDPEGDEHEELADNSEEIIDADAIIEQHNDQEELISEENEIILTQADCGEATDDDNESNFQSGEASEAAVDNNENDSQSGELTVASDNNFKNNSVSGEASEAAGDNIENNSQSGEATETVEDDIESNSKSGAVTKAADDDNEMGDLSHDIKASAEDVEMAAEPDFETQNCKCIKCMLQFSDGENWLRHKQLRHSRVKVMVKRLHKHVTLPRRSSRQKNGDQELTAESKELLGSTAIDCENPSTSNSKPLYKCYRCGKVCASDTVRRQHLKTCIRQKVTNSGRKNSAPSFHCKMCRKGFVHKLVWSFHQSRCKRNNPHVYFECVQCDQVFTEEKVLMFHQSQHNFSRTFSCTTCDKVFLSQLDLDQHTCSADDDRKMYKCGICRMLFPSLRALGKHVERHRKHRNKRKKKTEGNRFTVKCTTCGKCFVSKASLDFHIRSYNDTKSATGLKCAQCHMMFGKQSDYFRHMRIHQIYCFCPVCNQGFNNEDSLSVHRLTHSEESDRLTCRHCKKRFIAEEYLNKHMLSYHKDQNKKPDVRVGENASFTEKTRNDENILLVNVEKPFKCSECDLSFAILDNFTRHMQAHAIIRYTCNFCKAPFQKQQAYIEHVKTHTKSKSLANDEKLSTCYVCEDVFSSPSSLVQHMPSHINDGPHYCDSCRKYFSTKASLTRHLIRHSWNTLFKCDVCDKIFDDKFYMKSHTCEENGTLYGSRFTRRSYQVKRLRSQKKCNRSTYECVFCEKSFDSTRQLFGHIFKTKVSKGPKQQVVVLLQALVLLKQVML